MDDFTDFYPCKDCIQKDDPEMCASTRKEDGYTKSEDGSGCGKVVE